MSGRGQQSFGDLLREHRLASGLTQTALAERAGISRRAVQDLERGASRPHRDTMMRLIAVLEVPREIPDAMRRAATATPRRRSIAGSEAKTLDPGDSVQQTDRSEPRPSDKRLFGGREVELRQLRSALESCAAGRGGMVMLVGEPGIGKTALCEEVAALASASNALVLTGHCHEERSFALPYEPFVEAFATYARDRDAGTLRRQIGPHIVELARMVPTIRARLQLQLPGPIDASEDRFLLMEGVVDCVRQLAKGQPLLLVLEDLHDADRGTLDLLLHLARSLETSRVLVIGTYRDVEVDRVHPLSAALAELRRSYRFQRLRLRGLSILEVQRLLRAASHQAVPRPLAALLHGRTDGNALFVQELLRFLMDDLVAERNETFLSTARSDDLVQYIPEGLRDVVSRRVARLSIGANRTLRVAAVIGREFSLDILQAVRGALSEELENELEEAVDGHILEERSASGDRITYRFRHAFLRQVLYDEILAPRRIRPGAVRCRQRTQSASHAQGPYSRCGLQPAGAAASPGQVAERGSRGQQLSRTTRCMSAGQRNTPRYTAVGADNGHPPRTSCRCGG